MKDNFQHIPFFLGAAFFFTTFPAFLGDFAAKK